MKNDLARQKRLVHALMDKLGDPSADQLIETHISWLLLLGEHAYKIKKPLDLGFLDYTDPARREHFCREEIRLNRRTAPQLYLDAVHITGSPEEPLIGGDGTVLEHAVMMRRFAAGQLLLDQLQNARLNSGVIEILAKNIASFHAAAAVAGAELPWGSTASVYQPVVENFLQIRSHLPALQEHELMARLEDWSRERKEQLAALMETRKREGHIRECHGDLHLGNIVLLEGEPRPFDGIEFSDSLRWIDTLNDSAFLVMDLIARRRADLAWHFLDVYLQASGDYAALPLLDWYLGYRAMVRAKIAAIRSSQLHDAPELQSEAHAEYLDYLHLAADFTEPRPLALIITRGLSGSGKTSHSQYLLQKLGLIRLRSDIERKRLAGLPGNACSGSEPDKGLYSPAHSEKTYACLQQLAKTVVQAGLPVLVDATFLKTAQRQAFQKLAEELEIPFVILDFTAGKEELRRRILKRSQSGSDASEATLAVLDRQIRDQEILTAEERAHSIQIDTCHPDANEKMLQKLAGMIPLQVLSPRSGA